MSNAYSGAEALVWLLDSYGVRLVFGLCGDTSLPFYDALARGRHAIRHLLARDERHAAYMAEAWSRLTGRPGVVEGPSGGGATYMLPGVAEADGSATALVALTTDVAVTARGRFTLTELDQAALFRPVTRWSEVVDRPEALPRAVRKAFRMATCGRPGAVHLGIPFDVQQGTVPPEELWVEPRNQQWPAERPMPDPAEVERAARALREAERPLAICGGGVLASGAEAALLALAERLDLPVATSISGKGAIPETHPLAVGVVGSNGGTPETRALVDAADLVLFVGCRAGSVTTERWRHPKPGEVRVVHIDIDPAAIGTNYPTEAALVGDARTALEALLAALDPMPSVARRSRQEVTSLRERKFAAFRERALSDERPIRPERVVATFARLLPADAILLCDPGTPCPYFSAYFPLARAGRHFLSNRAHGALGWALPAALGAALARPEQKVVAVMGDGSFAMACGELETAVRLGLPVLFVVLANGSYGWIRAGQKTRFGGRYFSVDFGPLEHAAVARAFGLEAERVDDPRALEPAVARLLRASGPALLEILCQPLEEAAAPVSEWIA
ncbi:Acetolactate synthase isozyme 3 large subunit [bacterium HR40]|nr:Acetolactate synthase isozyme 3 large subunit [bacterium HR40]